MSWRCCWCDGGAPDGGYFTDGDRAAGVFGVVATGFSVLVGFLIFLAFTSYDDSRSGAETEALTLIHQIETAQSFDPPVAAELTGMLVCYGRSVVAIEWARMDAGTQGERINPWGVELFTTMRGFEPSSDGQQSAYDAWIDLTLDRETARDTRIHGAAGVIPIPLWVALFFASAIIFGFLLLFADSGERALSQAALMGSVVAVLAVLLLLLRFLDDPFHDGVGGRATRGDGTHAGARRTDGRGHRDDAHHPLRRRRPTDLTTPVWLVPGARCGTNSVTVGAVRARATAVPRVREAEPEPPAQPAIPFGLAEAKLQMPLARPGIVARPELLATMLGAPRAPVLSVIAPPGYGKTTALVQWAESKAPRAGWVSADDHDNDPIVLLTYIAAALDRIERLPPTLFRALASSGAGLEVPRRLVAALATMREPVALVIDHFEAVTNRECFDTIVALALGLPPGSQLAIGSRHALPLPAARLRAQGGIVEIGVDDLAMTETEAGRPRPRDGCRARRVGRARAASQHRGLAGRSVPRGTRCQRRCATRRDRTGRSAVTTASWSTTSGPSCSIGCRNARRRS